MFPYMVYLYGPYG